MGVAPSRTELYLPSDTIRVCAPDRCWCNGRHHNRSSKYVYVERGGDGRERHQDPVDMMGEFLMGGGGAAGVPWKNPGEWTVRDYERLGEVLNEWQMRERGRRRNPSSGNPFGGVNPYGQSPWDGGGDGGGSGRRRRTHPSWGEFERLQETVQDRFRRMAEEYQRHLSESDSLLFGSSTDHRREQYRNNMLKTLQEILPQLSQMMAAQQMGGGGMNMGMGMLMQNGMQGGMPGMGAMGGQPGMGMPGGGMGMNGINVNPMMNPMATAAMGVGAGMGQMSTPMMPVGGINDFGGGSGFPRRGRGRRERPFREDFDEEFGGGGGGGRRVGRPFRRGRRGGWDDDDEDLLGGNYGGDDTSPKMPLGGTRRPRRPGGGDFDGNGGIAHDQEAYRYHADEIRTTHSIPSRHAHFHPQPDISPSPGLGYAEVERPGDLERDIHPMPPPLRRPSPRITMPLDPDIRPASSSDRRHWPTGDARQAYSVDDPPIFSSGKAGEAVPTSLRPGPARRGTGIQPEARMSRQRDEEKDRKEPEAGAVPTKRDLQ